MTIEQDYDKQVRKELLIYPFEEDTTKIAGWHYKAFKQLEESAAKNNFKKLLIDRHSAVSSHRNSVYIRPSLSEDIVFMPADFFLNHEKLMEEYDADFSKKGADIIFRHERNHFNKQSMFLRKLESNIIQELFSNRNIENLTPSDFLELGKVREFFYIPDEMQACINDYVKNFESKEKFIDDYASGRVYIGFLHEGEKSLNQKYLHGTHSNVVKIGILQEADKKEEEIKKQLLDEYVERFTIYS